MPSKVPEPIRFLLNGEIVAVADAAPTETVLDWLRLKRSRTGTKEGCAEGDCGACTIAIGELNDAGGITWAAYNSCIRFLAQLDGKALLTVEDLADGETPHPVQAAMVAAHASQCGFCTPGFVMSLFAYFKTHAAGDDASLKDALSGNLCRCTGYRPILEAGKRMFEGGRADRFAALEADWAARLKSLKRDSMLRLETAAGSFLAPRDAAELGQVLRQRVDDTWLLAGGTDVGLWVTKQHRRPKRIVSVEAAADLKRIERHADRIVIGAGASYTQAHQAIAELHPDFAAMVIRLGSLPIRNAGTLGGNIANGSPIGDSLPALIALGAMLVLRSAADERILPLEDFFLGYRRTALRPDEFVARIEVPRLKANQRFAVYKLSKRLDQDISAVLGAFCITRENGTVTHARLAYGGMAAIPQRARAAEQALIGQPWSADAIEAACAALAGEFTPLTDMRASAAYRMLAAQNLLLKFHLESTSVSKLRIEAAE